MNDKQKLIVLKTVDYKLACVKERQETAQRLQKEVERVLKEAEKLIAELKVLMEGLEEA